VLQAVGPTQYTVSQTDRQTDEQTDDNIMMPIADHTARRTIGYKQLTRSFTVFVKVYSFFRNTTYNYNSTESLFLNGSASN